MPEIAKAYDPKQVESRWYAAWLENGCFRGQVTPGREPFSIVIPPPNVTGVLHMGHALNNTIQDILIRHARQQGKSAVWMPGTDHAGIATQTRVERELRKEGKTRHDLGREKFVERAKVWREKHGNIILDQLKKLGASCDWDRAVYTQDPGYNRAVLTAFVKLYQRGYIYRGKRMVNWCPVSHTGLSDEEVIMKPQKGTLYRMRYEIVEHPGQYLEISTTRPETLMGDTGVAVNPDDDRYKHLIGKHVWRPFPRQAIPIVADHAVDKSFGTGVLKVTPAHDKADFDIGKRHNLPIVDVMNPDGTLNELAGPEFKGMERFQARKVAAKKLAELGLLVKEEPYENSVGYSERADVPIEPRLSEQWFLRYPKVEEAKRVVQDGLIRFHPDRWTKTYLHWLNNIQDWCISRQLWWGHRIPVWYRKGADRNDPANRHVSLDGPSDPENWEQDSDVLDTWASSWLWPFATFGWPEPDKQQSADLAYWFPTSVLATGADIIFLWVARMIMASLELMGSEKTTLTLEDMKARIPYRDVYFNGIVRDEKGRKMSKSLGNSPDPLDLIAKYGADGLRFGLMSIAPQGQDVLFGEERVEQGRNFCNKLWNACRFRQMSGAAIPGDNASLDSIIARIEPARCDADDHAILGRLVRTLDDYQTALDNFEFNAATQVVYGFFWGDFCDWYVEVSKAKLQDKALKAHCLAIQDLCLRQVLLMLHPYTPFITEELWHDLSFGLDGTFIQNVDAGTGKALADLLTRRGLSLQEGAIQEIGDLREMVSLTRALKAQYNLGAKRDCTLFYSADTDRSAVIQRHAEKLKRLIGLATLERRESVQDAPAAVTPLGTVYLDLSSAVDAGAERERLAKELDRVQKIIAGIEAKLGNAAFTGKAPAQVVEGARAQLSENQAKRDEVQRLLKALAQ